MPTRTNARESLEVLLAQSQPTPTNFTRKTREVVRKPTELDDVLLDTFNNEEPMAIEVPNWAVNDTLKTLRKSVRFLEENTGEEMRLKLQTESKRNNKTLVKFLAHLPLERGRRVSRR